MHLIVARTGQWLRKSKFNFALTYHQNYAFSPWKFHGISIKLELFFKIKEETDKYILFR